MFNDTAVIFDLDGTMIDNNSFHLKAWQQFYKKRDRTLTEEEYKEHFNGKTNTDVLDYVFKQPLSEQESNGYTNEKEELYRRLYEPYIEPVKGLLNLLQQLKNQHIPWLLQLRAYKKI
jgi:beta-phosphoglucomutase-like phosphatase (HAD superfamily)